MTNEKEASAGCGLPVFGGIGVPSALGVAFIVLKLTGKIAWSWWWITAPFWAGYAFMILMVVFFFGGFAAFLGIFGLANWFFSDRR